MKMKVEKADISSIREIFNAHKQDMEDLQVGINEAAKLLKSNIEKDGILEFATKIISEPTNLNFPQENVLACMLFTEINNESFKSFHEDAKFPLIGASEDIS